MGGSLDIHSEAARQARKNAEEELRSQYGLSISIGDFSSVTEAELLDFPTFNWSEISRAPFGPTRLDIALRIDGVLTVLAIVTASGPAAIIRNVEANKVSRPSQFVGQALWAVLEVTANYATSLGKREIWWHPQKKEFLNFCVGTIGAKHVGNQCKLVIPE